jgi:hypothetical protein
MRKEIKISLMSRNQDYKRGPKVLEEKGSYIVSYAKRLLVRDVSSRILARDLSVLRLLGDQAGGSNISSIALSWLDSTSSFDLRSSSTCLRSCAFSSRLSFKSS